MRTKLIAQEAEKSSYIELENGLIQCEDGLVRPQWAAATGILRDYYDREWGIPTHDENAIFERLSLEAFQAGLSWITILKRRDAFRKAFYDFDSYKVAAMSDADIEELMQNPAIIRNRRKIEAARTNARAIVRLREAPQSETIAEIIWSYAPKNQKLAKKVSDLRPTSPESIALSKRLKKEGFVFVGPTTVHSTMEAIGAFDGHVEGASRPVLS